MRRAGLAPAVLAALLAVSPAGAATGDLPDLGPRVTVGNLPAGGTSIVRPAAGAPAAAVELWYRAPSTGFGPKPVPALARLAAQAVAASKPLVGSSVGQLIAENGGRLAITVYSDSVAISAVVPADRAKTVVKALTAAYFAPVLTDDGFRAAQRDVAQAALLESFNPESIVRDAVFASLFSGGPQHYAPLATAKEVSAIALTDVRAFATRAFRSQNAVFVASGDVDASISSAAAAGRPATGDVAGPEAAATPEIATSPEPVTGSFVEPTGGYGWIGPPISDQRESTAMDFIADYLFRPDAGYVAKAIADANPDALLVGQFITLHDPGVMFVAYSAKNLVAVKASVDAGLAMMQKPLEAGAFSAALAAFEYHLLSDLQTPTELADNFGWYAVEGSAAYAPGANGESGPYFVAAKSLTPEFVASVANKYLGKTPATVTFAPAKEKKAAQ